MFIGPLVHWSIGSLFHWSIGLLVHWSIGPFDREDDASFYILIVTFEREVYHLTGCKT